VLGVKLSPPPPAHPTPEKEIYFRRSYCKVHELLLGSFNTHKIILFFQKCLQFSPQKALIFSFILQIFVKEIKETLENILKIILFWTQN